MSALPVFAFLGDSLTLGGTGAELHSFPARLDVDERLFKQLCVSNFGKSGDTSSGFYTRYLAGIKDKGYSGLAITGCINDASSGVPAATSWANIQLIVDDWLAFEPASKPLWLIATAPTSSFAGFTPQMLADQLALRESFRTYAAANPTRIRFIDQYLSYPDGMGDPAVPGNLYPLLDYGDGRHFNAAGNQFLADLYAPLLLELFPAPEEEEEPVVTGYSDEGIDQRAEATYNAADSLTYYVKRNGAAVAIDADSGYVTIYDPGGSTKVARVAVTTTTSGKLVYTRTWESPTFELWEDYVALFEWQESGVTRTDRLFFDVVRSKLECLIDESDMLEQYPDAADHLAALNITDPTRFIKRAWSVMLDRIRSGKNRPSLILDRARLVNPALEGATARMCRALSKETGDIWHERMTHHFREYNALIAGLGDIKYDKDEDGLAGDNDVKRMNRRTATV